MQLFNFVLLIALLKSVEPQNQCVREIRSLKDDLQNELREIVRNTITESSVSREDVQELVEEKATREDVQSLDQNMAAGNQLIKDTLDTNHNTTIESLEQIVRDKATKKDVEELHLGNQAIMDTIVANQNTTRNEVTNISQVVTLLNDNVATGNDLTMEALSQIVATQELVKNASILNSDISNVPEDQCVTRDEVRAVIREEVESVVGSEVQSIVQRELESLQFIVERIESNTATLLKATTHTHTCSGTSGWKQVVFIDMTNTSHNCPPGLNLTSHSKRTCGRAHQDNWNCSSTTFSVEGSKYSQVCGRIIGYQVGSTTSFTGYTLNSYSLNNQYVDGVSLTHGPDDKRQHIWTFAAGLTEGDYSFQQNLCPCDRSTLGSPSFVGNNYFCESGTNRQWGSGFHGIFFPDDPLWDGQGCSSTSTCCQFNNPPWFTEELPNPTTNDIELRLCLYNGNPLSDVPLELIEFYVK